MKKLLIIALVLSLVISLLSSCGILGGDDTSETTDEESTAEELDVTDTEEQDEETSEEETTEEITTEEPTTEVETEPEISFPGAASPKLEEIAKKMATADEYVIFTIGDSVTQGQQASDPKTTDYTGRFAVKLAEVFSDKTIFRYDSVPNSAWDGVYFPKRGVRIQNGTNGRINIARCGLGGDTTEKTLNRKDDFIDTKINQKTGDLFIICLGINDSWPGKPPISVYKENLGLLVDEIQTAHPNADIILMTPTYITDNPSRPLVDFANAMKEVADDKEVACIDLNAMFNENYAKSNPENWLSDNCHPNDAGYNMIANEMIRCLFGIEME